MDAFEAAKQGEEYGLMVRNAIANSAASADKAFGIAVGFVGGFFSALKNGDGQTEHAEAHYAEAAKK